MPLFVKARTFLRNLFSNRRVEADLDQEVQSHFAMLAEEKVRAGMSPEEARRAAHIELGGIEQLKEQVREERIGNWFHAVLSDCRFALRQLRKNPGFTAVAVLTLALGIGACSIIFSVFYGVLVRPLPYPAADRVVRVYMHFHPQDMDYGTMSPADFQDWQAQNRSFESLGIFNEGAPFEIDGKSESELVPGAFVTSGFFSTLGERPLLGRVFLPADDKMDSANAVVLSEGLWRRLFNSNPNTIGQSLRLNGDTYTVVGVMPRSFRLPSEKDELWANYSLDSVAKRPGWFSYGIGRLKPSVTLEQAQIEVNEIGRRIEQVNPMWYTNLTLPLVPLRESIIGDVRPALLLMFGAVVFVLLITIVNVSNLVLVRATSRTREIAMRRSLGAGPARIALQLTVESMLLAFAGGTQGIALAYCGVKAAHVWHPENLPRVEDIRLDGTLVAFTCFVTLGAAVFCSVLPAVLSLKVDLNSGLKKAESVSIGNRSRVRPQSVLVISEIALSVALLIGAGLLLRSFLQLQRVDAGFHAPPENVLALKLWITRAKPVDPAQRTAIFEHLLEKVRILPGIRAAAFSRTVPPDGGPVGFSPFMIEGQTWDVGGHPSFPYLQASEDYFSALAIPLLKGRYFTQDDTVGSRKVAIISGAFAQRYFPNEDPLGKRIKLGGPESPQFPYLKIVGVVGDVKYFGLAPLAEPAVYVPLTQDVPIITFLVVRSNLSAASVARQVERSIQAMDGDLVLVHTNTMEDLLWNSVAEPRFRTTLLGIFAGTALVLAAIGVYGVLAYSVVQHTHEIGVRIAVGAQRRDISRFILGQGVRLTAAGLAIGIAISLSLTSVLRGLLFQVNPSDPLTLACVAFLLGLTALAACYVPARRASRVDPMVALRYE
jgi:predicted permease